MSFPDKVRSFDGLIVFKRMLVHAVRMLDISGLLTCRAVSIMIMLGDGIRREHNSMYWDGRLLDRELRVPGPSDVGRSMFNVQVQVSALRLSCEVVFRLFREYGYGRLFLMNELDDADLISVSFYVTFGYITSILHVVW